MHLDAPDLTLSEDSLDFDTEEPAAPAPAAPVMSPAVAAPRRLQVWVVDARGTLRRQPVTLGVTGGERTEVLGREMRELKAEHREQMREQKENMRQLAEKLDAVLTAWSGSGPAWRERVESWVVMRLVD
mgnify:CR=1 FL=1